MSDGTTKLARSKKTAVHTLSDHFHETWQYTGLLLLAFLVIPLILLVLRVEPGSLWTTLRVVEVRQAIGVSLKTTVISLALILFFGTPLAYLLGRHTFRGRRFLDACIDLPIVLPPAVAGIALLIAFGRRGVLGQALEACGIQVAFTPLAVIMAQVFVASSFYIRAAALGFAAIPEELEEAARLDGATRWQTFLRVVLPLSHKAIISGGAMSWARALGEFGATIIFAGNLPGPDAGRHPDCFVCAVAVRSAYAAVQWIPVFAP
jgi:molybdate transport system permease protein